MKNQHMADAARKRTNSVHNTQTETALCTAFYVEGACGIFGPKSGARLIKWCSKNVYALLVISGLVNSVFGCSILCSISRAHTGRFGSVRFCRVEHTFERRMSVKRNSCASRDHTPHAQTHAPISCALAEAEDGRTQHKNTRTQNTICKKKTFDRELRSETAITRDSVGCGFQGYASTHTEDRTLRDRRPPRRARYQTVCICMSGHISKHTENTRGSRVLPRRACHAGAFRC